jgi:hypothetical protein
MEQDENDRNHKKESTLVVDNKPNGKSQLRPKRFKNWRWPNVECAGLSLTFPISVEYCKLNKPVL